MKKEIESLKKEIQNNQVDKQTMKKEIQNLKKENKSQ